MLNRGGLAGCTLLLAMQAGDALAQTTLAPVPKQKMDEIRVSPQIEPEDRKSVEKPPLQKMNEFLNGKGRSLGTVVTESPTSDGRRIAEITMGDTVFCVEDRRGQIDFSGIGRGGMATRPAVGKHCR